MMTKGRRRSEVRDFANDSGLGSGCGCGSFSCLTSSGTISCDGSGTAGSGSAFLTSSVAMLVVYCLFGMHRIRIG